MSKKNKMNDIEGKILKFLKARKWDKLRPSDLAKSIMIEGAELLEVFQWSSMELEDVLRDSEKMGRIKKELADVFIYCLQMSVLLKLDTQKMIEDKLDHVDKKYPAEAMRNRSKEAGTEDLYLKIKQNYRANGMNK